MRVKYVIIALITVILIHNVCYAKQRARKKHCEHVPTPTPTIIVTPTPNITPVPTSTPINDIGYDNYIPFNQVFEVTFSSIKDGDKQIALDIIPFIEMSMVVNSDRLGEEAFELRIVLERDYDTLILGENVNIIPELYSVHHDGTNARHIRLYLDQQLYPYTNYRLVIKQDQHLIVANNAGDTLQKDYVVYFTTGL